MNNKLIWKLLIVKSIILLIIFLTPKVIYASDIIKRDKKLPKNIYLNKINIGGFTLKNVEDLMDEKVREKEEREVNISFSYNDEIQNRKFKLSELGYITNKEDIKKQISLLIYNDLNLINKVKQHIDIRKNGRYYEIIENIDYNKYSNSISKFDFKKLPTPVDAKYLCENGWIKIIPDKPGVQSDKIKLFNEIILSLESKQKNFTLGIKELKAKITKEILEKQGVKERIASYTTSFASSNIPRSSNIRLATKVINGTIVPPGEIFSFNKVVGARTKGKGYQEAGIYRNGNLDQGLGGGICQVSTTLYNAVLLSDLEIIERDNHSLTVHYVPLSRDAAVSYGVKDLKFKNNTNHYIYINGSTTESTVTFNLFSTKGNRRIVLISKTIGKIDSPIKYLDDEGLRIGRIYIEEEGRTGYESKLIRRIYENEKLIKEEIVSHDKYKPIPMVIRRGTR